MKKSSTLQTKSGFFIWQTIEIMLQYHQLKIGGSHGKRRWKNL